MKHKLAAILLSIMMGMTLPVTTVFAQTNEPTADTGTEETPVEETTEPEEPEELDPLTPDGNLTLVDDITTSTGKQFITVVTKSGNFFYLIIDRDDEGENTVHFLNQVDEQDLLALMDEDDAKAITDAEEAAEAQKKAEEEAAKAAAEETEQPAPETVETDRKSNTAMIPAAVIGILVLAGGGIWFFLQTRKKKKDYSDRLDPDADYREDDDGYDLPEEEDSGENEEE